MKYNGGMYNAHRYNTDIFYITLMETVSETDATLSSQPQQVFREVMSVSDNIRVDITNKALNETVRVNDWISLKMNPQSDPWGG